MRWARRPPAAPNTTSGSANSVMPRLAIHSAVCEVVEGDRPQRIERTDHHPHRAPHQQGAGVGAQPQQVERQPLRRLGRVDGLDDLARAADHERQGGDDGAGDDEEGHGDPEAPDQQRGHGRTGGEAGDVGGEQAPEVVPDAVGVGEDHDAPHGRHGHPDADTHHEATEQQGEERAGEGEQHESGDVDADAGEHQLAGVATVGQRGDQHLGEEPGEEADADHCAEGALADPVLVADVVEHREQRPVAHRQQAEHEPERHEHRPAPGRTGRAHDRPR